MLPRPPLPLDDQIPTGPFAVAAVEPACGLVKLGNASPTVTGWEEATGALAGCTAMGADAIAAELAGAAVPPAVDAAGELLAPDDPSPPPHPAITSIDTTPATIRQIEFFFISHSSSLAR